MVSTFQTYFTLALSELVEGSFAQLRRLYESHVVTRYVIEHKDLAERFLDHAVVVQRRIILAMGKGVDFGRAVN